MIFLFLVNLLGCFVLVYSKHPEVYLNMEQRVVRHGYPIEIHQVTTEDDYILNLYRIPYGWKKNKNESKNKSVVLFAHGLGGSPQNFIALGPKYAPAYYFADRGFDVWLFCPRGAECQNPKKHKRFNWNKDQIYWDFSFHEIGVHDLSASIDLILNKTDQNSIFYVGHSAGGPTLYALLSERPEYNKKIKLFANYGAGVVTKELDYPFLQVISQLSAIFKNIYAAIGMYEVLPASVNKLLGDTIKTFCADPKRFKACKIGLWCFGSHISTLIEDDVVEVALSVMPRLSIKQLGHSMDNMNRGDFRKYDYGSKKNIMIYGRKLPPAYNLSTCTVPNAFFYGSTDSLCVPEDVWATQAMLPNTILDYEVGPKFIHLDFIFAKNASHMVYKPTVKLFKDFDAGIIPPKVTRKERNENVLS